MKYLEENNGDKSSKRLGGMMLIMTSCVGAILSILLSNPAFITLLIGLATIGAGLLGSTMVERKLK